VSVAARLRVWAALLDTHRDVLEGRVLGGATPPAWVAARGWGEALLALSDDALLAGETRGLAAALTSDAPASLRALGADLEAWTAPFRRAPARDGASPTRGVKARKRRQIAALAGRLREASGPRRRLVDVGAGHGHLTRALSEALGIEARAVEADPARAERGSTLAEGSAVRFEVADGMTRRFAPGDLVVGLHPCGALGDAVVRHAAAAGADLFLVSCCLQKTVDGGPRRPLTDVPLTVPRAALGLANLTHGLGDGPGIEAAMARRSKRLALRRLLRARGVDLGPGDEVRGVHRRHFERPFAEVAAEALTRRGLPGASADELRDIEAAARVEHGRIRRLALPRSALGRLLELALVGDRAAYLEARGYRVSLEPAFDAAISPRNLLIVGTAPPRGLSRRDGARRGGPGSSRG
jgi:hypothetical protein